MSSHTLCNDFTKWPSVSFPGLPRYPPKAVFQHLWLEVGSVWSGMWGRDPEVENGCWDPAVPGNLQPVGLSPGGISPA